MKRKIKTLLMLALALCLVAVTAMPALALSRQEEYYLSVLRPALPKTAGAASYPARLRVDIAGRPPTSFSLSGKIGMDASISDEELLAILKSGLAGEKTYKELQNPVDDKVLVQDLTQKLKFSDQDMLDNWKKLLGIDAVAELLSGKLPDIGASDVVNSIVDGLQGDIPMMPGLPGVGTVIDGAFVSWDEFQKDQQKYKDIIALSQAKQRLRSYYAKVDQLIRDFISDKGDWTIRIDGRDTQPYTFHQVEGNTQTLTADVRLVKADGSAGNVTGTYTGRFNLHWEADLGAFDAGYGAYLQAVFDGNVLPPGISVPTIPMRYRSARWVLATDEGPPSEDYIVLEAEEYSVNLALPAGVNRAFLELPLSAEPLFVTDFVRQVQRVVFFDLVAPECSGSWDMSLNYDDTLQIMFDDWEVHAPEGSYYGDNTESYNFDPDITPYMRMTLVVDMLD